MQFVLGDRSLTCFVGYRVQIDQKGRKIVCSTELPCPTLSPAPVYD
uniref:Uncharacterized protein n=1 Tax=Arundo donax TaxID=35708 RepID=A0A0A9E575_ARUDO